MRTQATFQAWLEHVKETLRLRRAMKTDGDADAVGARDAEGQRLWEACLADGWTQEDGMAALEQARAVGQ